MFKKSRRQGFTLIELLVVVAIIALLVSILLPSLSRAKALAKSVVCQNRFRAARSGFDYYSSDFNGAWMANWDKKQDGAGGQWPFTMMLYCKGVGISDGKPVCDPNAGWFSVVTEERGGPGPFTSGMTSEEMNDMVPSLHCEEIDALGEPFVGQWYPYATISQLIPNRKVNGTWGYRFDEFFKPDAMTHPGSTVHLQCMVYLPNEGQYNVWMEYGMQTEDPHLDKSNYLFADGHVESLGQDQTDEQMWKDMYEMGED